MECFLLVYVIYVCIMYTSMYGLIHDCSSPQGEESINWVIRVALETKTIIWKKL